MVKMTSLFKKEGNDNKNDMIGQIFFIIFRNEYR